MLANPTPPSGQVVPAEIEYDLAFDRGVDRHRLNVQVFVGFTSDMSSQMKLDEYLAGSGPTSVKAALESDKTLAGACSDLQVKRCGGYQLLARESGGPVLMAEWEIEVLATGA